MPSVYDCSLLIGFLTCGSPPLSSAHATLSLQRPAFPPHVCKKAAAYQTLFFTTPKSLGDCDIVLGFTVNKMRTCFGIDSSRHSHESEEGGFGPMRRTRKWQERLSCTLKGKSGGDEINDAAVIIYISCQLRNRRDGLANTVTQNSAPYR